MDLETLVVKYVGAVVLYEENLRNMKSEKDKVQLKSYEMQKNEAYKFYIDRLCIASMDEINSLRQFLTNEINSLYIEVQKIIEYKCRLYQETVNNELKNSQKELTFCDNLLKEKLNLLAKYENISTALMPIQKEKKYTK